MGKIIFLDIDGTLVDFESRMPKSAGKALKEAKKNGHRIAICTGRTYTGIYPWLLEFPFDGLVCSAGAYIKAADKVIYHHTMHWDRIQVLIELLSSHNAFYVLQGIDGGFADKRNQRKLKEFLTRRGIDTKKILKDMAFTDKTMERVPIESAIYFNADADIRQLQARIDEKLDGYFQITGASFGEDIMHSGEVTCRGINKATGIMRLMEHFHMDHSTSVAIGDGSNDFEMIRYAHTGIAMGNSVEELKKEADYVTDRIEEDGIYKAFIHFGFI